MWDEPEGHDSRADGTAIIWSWAIVALIVVGLFAWSAVDQIMTNAPASVVAEPSSSGSGKTPAGLNEVAPGAGPLANTASR